MRESAMVLCVWITEAGTMKPSIQNDFDLTHPGDRVKDMTGQLDANIPTDPNNCTNYIECPSVEMDLIDADSNYVILPGTRFELPEPYDPESPIAPTELTPLGPDIDSVPAQNEWVAHRNNIMAIRDPGTNGPIWNMGQLNQAIGPTVNGRTWRQLHEELNAFMCTAPRKVG